MFCDVRGFTAASSDWGLKGSVHVMNDVFQIIEDEILPRRGEILVMNGDALLVVFPRCPSSLTHRLPSLWFKVRFDPYPPKVEEHGRELGTVVGGFWLPFGSCFVQRILDKYQIGLYSDGTSHEFDFAP